MQKHDLQHRVFIDGSRSARVRKFSTLALPTGQAFWSACRHVPPSVGLSLYAFGTVGIYVPWHCSAERGAWGYERDIPGRQGPQKRAKSFMLACVANSETHIKIQFPKTAPWGPYFTMFHCQQ